MQLIHFSKITSIKYLLLLSASVLISMILNSHLKFLLQSVICPVRRHKWKMKTIEEINVSTNTIFIVKCIIIYDDIFSQSIIILLNRNYQNFSNNYIGVILMLHVNFSIACIVINKKIKMSIRFPQHGAIK